MRCEYEVPWVGRCNKQSGDNKFCVNHNKLKCRCGKKATKGCESASSLVCGEPVCSDCNECGTHKK